MLDLFRSALAMQQSIEMAMKLAPSVKNHFAPNAANSAADTCLPPLVMVSA
jgi:hypothetical protein